MIYVTDFEPIFLFFIDMFSSLISFMSEPILNLGLIQISIFSVAMGGLLTYIAISLFWKGGSA